ncbi:MAG: cytochrome c biogenesis protein CcsA [Candidatus Hydrogenedentes bacterium]|nr:cytochrome c biogenesis protein CcsA [Candidatus Hydrogenedentota bacterium]
MTRIVAASPTRKPCARPSATAADQIPAWRWLPAPRNHSLTTISWIGVLLLCSVATAAEQTPAADGSSADWSPQTVHMFAMLAVQEGGRVKPLDTYAGFTLLKLNGRRSCTNLAGKRLTPIQWLMDSLFYPEMARQYKTFLVDNADVLAAIGVSFEERRARYSYDGLAPARDRLMDLAHSYMGKEGKERTLLENQIANLAQNMLEFERLTHFLDFARRTYPVGENAALADLFPGQPECRLSALLAKGPDLSKKLAALHNQENATPEQKTSAQALSKLFREIDKTSDDASALAVFPPATKDEIEWRTPADLISCALQGGPSCPDAAPLIAGLEDLVQARDDRMHFATLAEALSEKLAGLAAARGEYGKIGLEVAYYRLDLFYYSLTLSVLSFILIAVSWMAPGRRIVSFAAIGSISLAAALLSAGIAMRCVIRGRPPVTTLYETILFVTAVAVVVSLFMEWVNRQRVALALASVLGMAGLFLANKYEAVEGLDTMPSMVAVLDTNFWLATHVTTITIGYAAGLLAGALSHVYVFGQLLGWRRGDAALYRGLTRMVYGVFCFALFFSVVGTVLGGIWANESWGRFWGWDPKENGALMIVLWQLTVLHARTGGLIRDYGVHLGAIFGGVVVAFSWFGVNLLGVGLHSYGFTSGVHATLTAFYLVEAVVLFAGCAAWWRARGNEPGTLEPAAAPKVNRRAKSSQRSRS